MTTAKKLRHPSDGGYARGDETRCRIIGAAIELFVEHGFDSASTRDIADHAGVNAPALQYYFENKEGLYLACLEVIVNDAWNSLGPAIGHARDVLRTNADLAGLLDAYIRIEEAIVDIAFSKAPPPFRWIFVAHEPTGYSPESAKEFIAHRIRKPVTDAIAALVARTSRRAADDPITLIRTFSLLGQMAAFFGTERSTLSLVGRKGVSDATANEIKSLLAEQTNTLFEKWREERDPL